MLPFRKKKGEQQEAGNTISGSDVHKDRVLSFLVAENPAARSSKDGKRKQLAGTVEIFHIPSLPIRLPSRFPLDAPTDDMFDDGREKGEGLADLPGLSRLHAELIERDPPLPFKSWTLEVPLGESDLISGSLSSSSIRAGGARQREVPLGKDDGGYTLKNVDEVPVSVQNARMGMDGKVIVVLGTKGRVWVYRIKDGHCIGSSRG